jgi:hypothetical protein
LAIVVAIPAANLPLAIVVAIPVATGLGNPFPTVVVPAAIHARPAILVAGNLLPLGPVLAVI